MISCRTDGIQEIAEFVSGFSFDDIPTDVVSTIEDSFIDTIGVTLAGVDVGAGAKAIRAISEIGGSGTEIVPGTAVTGSATDIAFATGTAAHCLDFDDTTSAMNGHPSVCLISPMLSVSQSMSISGTEAFEAYAAGFETMAAIAAPISPDHYQRGWHPTGTLGCFGAAATLGKLKGADSESLATALNIAASMAAGVKNNFGTMVKPMHVGQAARSGLTAAILAENGFTASQNAITGDDGFFELFRGRVFNSDGVDLAPWQLSKTGINRKKYPCCFFAHAAIDTVLTLSEEQEIEREEIESVSVTLSQGARDALRYHSPTNGFEGRFSLQYTVAHAIVHGDVGLNAFDTARISSDEIRNIQPKIDVEVDDQLPYSSYISTVTIETTDSEFTMQRANPPGVGKNRLSTQELNDKFRNCLDTVTSREKTEALLSELRDIRNSQQIFESLYDL